jgi:hypothetical protein
MQNEQIIILTHLQPSLDVMLKVKGDHLNN